MTEHDLTPWLREMVGRQASDLYLKAFAPPCLRVDGALTPLPGPSLTPEQTDAIGRNVMDETERAAFAETNEMDIALFVEGVGRFRVNVYRQQGCVALVFRSIRQVVPSFEELNLPADVLRKLCHEERGLVLITGIAGSGKSTTIAAMIAEINRTQRKHVITIEDPIEYVFPDDQSIISQREVGLDTRSFHNALRHVIRQSPDVIFIGEMRDLETMSSAIMGAETGHLVLSTLHTLDAVQTVERIINFFPPYQHSQVRMQLSLVLKGVISQRLLVRADGAGRIPACEVMLATPSVRKILLEGRTPDLIEVIPKSMGDGMRSFNQSLISLLKRRLVTQDEARKYSSNVEELDLALRGIYSGVDTHTASGE
jgi:twitching motility protein PilT